MSLVLDRLAAIETRLTAHGQEMRDGFKLLTEKLEAHTKDDQIVEGRVRDIETTLRIEEKRAVRHGTWAGILAAAGLTAALRLLESLWWKRP